MSIDAVAPVFRDIPVESAVPQLSLTRRDRELQMKEGQPPTEVAEVAQDALAWRKDEDLREKWKKRQCKQEAKRTALQGTDSDDIEQASVALAEPTQTSTELQEEEATGTLFDDRS